MKVSAILGVLLLVAGVSSASLTVTTEVSDIGAIGTGTLHFYGVTVHFVGANANEMLTAVDLRFNGSMYQVWGARGVGGTRATVWIDQVQAQLTNGTSYWYDPGDGSDPIWVSYPNDLTPLAARFDSHLLISSLAAQLPAGNTPYETEPTNPAGKNPFFANGPAPDTYWPNTAIGKTTGNPLPDPVPPAPQYEGNIVFAMGGGFQQDLPFAYFVIPANKKVLLTGEAAYSLDGPTGNLTDKVLFTNFEITTVAIPEPATMAMLALGAVGLIMRKRRRA